MRAASQRSTTHVVFSLAAILLFGAFSLSGALGSAFGSRATSQAEQTTNDGTRARLQRSYDDAKTELDVTAPARPAAELEALVAKLKGTPGANGCTAATNGPISRKVCGEAATVAIELGRAQRRAELEVQIKKATAALDNIKPPQVVNADAVALSTFAGKIGVAVTPEALNPWLALLAVALVELGGGICFALAGVLRDTVHSAPVERVEKQVSTAPNIRVADTIEEAEAIEAQMAIQQVPTAGPSKLVVPDNFAGRLLMMLKDRGGEVYSGHRALGRALGCSPAHVGNVLRDLAEAGRVTVCATKTGTVVRLLEGLKAA